MEAIAFDDKNCIGYLLMYSTSFRYVKDTVFDKAFEAFTKRDLKHVVKPEKPRPIDAFKFAMQIIKDKYNDKENVGEDKVLLVRNLKTAYVIVIENRKGTKLQYRSEMTILLNKDKDNFLYEIHYDGNDETLLKIKDEINELYTTLLNSYISTDIRQLIRQVLLITKSIKVRMNGAVYFMPRKYKEYLDALVDIAETLSENGYPIELKHFPVVDMPKYRNQIIDSLYNEIYTELEAAKKEYTTLYDKYEGKIPPSLRSRIIKRLQRLTDLIKFYKQNIESQIDLTENVVKVLADAVIKSEKL